MIVAAAVFTGLGVALGAFGAHALRATLEASGRFETWQTAVHYHLLHGVAWLALGIWSHAAPPARAPRGARMVAGLWAAGIVCFSGSLYLLGLGAPGKVFGPITPIGGVSFLAGWIVLALTACRGCEAPAHRADDADGSGSA